MKNSVSSCNHCFSQGIHEHISDIVWDFRNSSMICNYIRERFYASGGRSNKKVQRRCHYNKTNIVKQRNLRHRIGVKCDGNGIIKTTENHKESMSYKQGTKKVIN